MNTAFLKEYCYKINKECEKLHKQLVELVNELNDEINIPLDNAMYALVYNEFAEVYTEYKIHKLRVKDNCLEVYIPDYYYEFDYTEEDLWFPVMTMTVVNATLYSICENLECLLNDYNYDSNNNRIKETH